MSFKEVQIICSGCWNVLPLSSKLSIPLENGRIYIVNISILTIGEGNVMFISDHKVFDVICLNSVYGLVKGKISIRLV